MCTLTQPLRKNSQKDEYMAELRYNPLLGTWTMVASHRQNRPQMPKNWCPFCPGSGKVPEHYDVHKYDNDFPALSSNPPEPDDVGSDFYKTAPAYEPAKSSCIARTHEDAA
jgi:UDPglucose--hexose-1-phosphate uridylyltransferase